METAIPVRDIMTRPVITADANMDVLTAAGRMSAANVGCLIITSNERPIGILTERDLVKKIVAKAVDPKTAKVEDVMSSHLFTISS